MALPALQPTEPYLDDDEPEGFVLRIVERADGTVEEQQLPLTMELLLHPREGDKMTQSDFHSLLLSSLLERIRCLEPGVAVFTDLLFCWDRPGLPDAAPDVAVVAGLSGTRIEITNQVQGKFDVASFGRRPHLMIEVVSPRHKRLREKDLKHNVKDYARAGVREYLIVNPGRMYSMAPLQLLGYRLEDGSEYTEIEPDEQGRILSETTGLLFGSDPDRRWIEIFDAATGERVLDAQEARERAQQEAARAEQEAARAEQQTARAEQEAARAKQQTARAEQEAARATQQTARAEQEAASRKAAEARAQAAEEKLAKLEARMRRRR